MAGVFGHTRLKSIAAGAVRRYLAYAVGEVLLIFVGVTLAVAFDNAAEARRQDDLARGLLEGVRQNLVANQEELQSNIDGDEAILELVARVVSSLDSGEPWSDSQSAELAQARYWSSPFLTTSGYESLKQAGMHSVRDEGVDRSIVHLFETTYGFLVGDHDRTMWVFEGSVVNPLFGHELLRMDEGGESPELLAPADLSSPRVRGAIRTMLLEHEGHLRRGLELRRAALEETRDVMRRLDDALR